MGVGSVRGWLGLSVDSRHDIARVFFSCQSDAGTGFFEKTAKPQK